MQSKKERQQIVSGLDNPAGYVSATIVIELLLDKIDLLNGQVMKIEKVLEKLVKEDSEERGSIAANNTWNRNKRSGKYRSIYR